MEQNMDNMVKLMQAVDHDDSSYSLKVEVDRAGVYGPLHRNYHD